MAAKLFTFPNPVNEVSARLVAGGVVILTSVALLFSQEWLVLPIALGFVARVLTGPKLSPLGLFVTRVLTPALPFEAKYVAGPPKRFAQGIGAAVTGTGAILYFGFGLTGATQVLLGLIIVAATLESVFAVCIGCQFFALLMHFGIIPEEVCERCGNIWLDQHAPA